MGSDGSSIPLWIAFFCFLLCSAYFSGVECSYSVVNRIRIKARAEEGNKRAKRAFYILNHFDKALTTLLVGNNLVNVATASVATVLATRLLASGGMDTESFGFSMLCTGVTTAVIFLFGEMLPKTLANDRSMSLSMAAGGSLRFLMRLFTPVTAVFGLISNAVSRVFARDEEPSITTDELIDILDTAEEEGVVDEEQGDILKSAIEFDETLVGDVMTMAKDIEFIDATAAPEEILRVIRASVHSRLPVYSGSPERVIGTLRIRRYLTEYRQNHQIKLKNLINPPYFVRENAKVDDVLNDMRQHKHHMAIVVNEDKKAIGLVTIEDFLEELVGEIFDEEDVVDHNFQSLGGNKYLVNTHMLLGNVYERMGLPAAPRAIAAKPILSFLLENLGHLPVEGESFLYEDLEFEVETVEARSATYVNIRILDEEDLAARRAADREEVAE